MSEDLQALAQRVKESITLRRRPLRHQLLSESMRRFELVRACQRWRGIAGHAELTCDATQLPVNDWCPECLQRACALALAEGVVLEQIEAEQPTCSTCRFWFETKEDSDYPSMGFCNEHETDWPAAGHCHRHIVRSASTS